MSFFGLSKSSDRYGVIIDIGSGSVLTAIVHSNPKLSAPPHIVWSHREHAPLRNIDSLEQSAKAVMTALVNSSMLLDAEGRKALYEYNSSAKLTAMQCSISAPWSYTVTKTVNYKQEESFEITKELIDELITAIQDKIQGELSENEALRDMGLQVIARVTMDTLSNGYRVTNPIGGKAQELTVSRASVVAQQYLVDAIAEMQDKLFSGTSNQKLSFILVLFAISQDLYPELFDTCLVDITYEATEIGVVRDGILSYSTHTPFGSFSLAREIAKITNVPLHEAFGYLHTEKPMAFLATLTDRQREEVDTMFEAYTERVSTLFHETGDNLSIPKRILLHTDPTSETLFTDLIENAAKRAIKSDPNISPVSTDIIKQLYLREGTDTQGEIPSDTALLVSAWFFHKQQQELMFEYF